MTNPNDEVREKQWKVIIEKFGWEEAIAVVFRRLMPITNLDENPPVTYVKANDQLDLSGSEYDIKDIIHQLLASERKQLAQDIKNWTKGKTVTKDKLRNYLNQIIKESGER